MNETDQDVETVDREEVVRFEKWRPTHLTEMVASAAILAVVAVPVMWLTEYDSMGVLAGMAVLTVIQEGLWRYRGFPELAPSGRLKDALQ